MASTVIVRCGRSTRRPNSACWTKPLGSWLHSMSQAIPSKVEVGARFGRLVVTALVPHRKNPMAICQCDCGAECKPQRGALRNGRATSCGCSRREKLLATALSHGRSGSPEYRVFEGIIDRCRNPRNLHFKNYGGRGIECRWASFDEFFQDMGERPAGAWIDRIDNDGHYEASNCRWREPRINQENKRVSKFWRIDGVVYQSSVRAAQARGVSPSVIVRGCNGYSRRGIWHPPRRGWSSEFKYPKESGQ